MAGQHLDAMEAREAEEVKPLDSRGSLGMAILVGWPEVKEIREAQPRAYVREGGWAPDQGGQGA